MSREKTALYFWAAAGAFFCLSLAACAWPAVSRKAYNYANATYLHANGETPSLNDPETTPDGRQVLLPIRSNLCAAKGKISSVDNVFAFKAAGHNTQVLLSWSPVTRYADMDIFDTGAAADQPRYIVYYTSTRGSDYIRISPASFDSRTFSCTQIIGADSPAYYYTMAAVDDMDNTGGYAMETDRSNNKFVYPSQGETMTYLAIPSAAASALYQGEPGNIGDDIFIDASDNPGEEGKWALASGVNGQIVKSVSFSAYGYTNRRQLPSFSFTPAAQIVINYDAENGKVKNTALPLSKAAERLGLYFYNGVEWLKIPAEINAADRTLTASVGHISKYAVIAGGQNPGKLTLIRRIPAIFTPNSDGNNDYVFFYYKNPAKKPSVKLKIFDLSGALVREIDEQVNGRMEWDGKDVAGGPAESGVYIYQIQAGTDEFVSGSLMLAK